MHLNSVRILCIVVIFLLTQPIFAQSTPIPPHPTTSPPISDPQERVKVFTEEVVFSATADAFDGHLSAFPRPDDVLVFEDDVQQAVRSIRRVPANVLLALDTGGALNPAMRVSTTREVATKLISSLGAGDRIAAIQFGSNLELFQPWTTNKDDLLWALKTKLLSGKRPQLAKALSEAALELSEVPAGRVIWF